MSVYNTILDNIWGRISYYLRSNGYTKTIKLYNNLGIAYNDYKAENSDTIHSAVYGVYRNQSSQINAVSEGLNMLTGAAVIDLLVDAYPEEDGHFPEVEALVGLLNGCAGQITGLYFDYYVENDGPYAVLPVMSMPTVGTYQEESSNFGAFVPISVQINFTALRGAMAPSTITLKMDGEVIPTTDLVISRTKTSTADVQAQSSTGSTVNSDESSTIEIQLACPAQSGATDTMLDELIDGGTNQPHCVVLEKTQYGKTKLQCYLMEIAKTQLTKASNATIGLNCNLLELDAQTADIPYQSAWSRTTVTASGANHSASIPLYAGTWCVFWGDGTSSGPLVTSGAQNVTHNYSTDGIYTVIYYKWE
ncbi:MAG: hypothetical protein IJX76_04915 [Clostridia bacterium]|nr:hypothetical protein [Clostridia bacterium]